MKKLAIDCGGTKIEVATLVNGIFETETFNFCGNININETNLITKLQEIIDYSFDIIVVGVAGYRSYPNKQKLLEVFGTKVKFMSDIDLAALSLLHNEDGFICVLGTGSVMANVQKEINVIGGYGHVIGDIGSGYHFGKVLITQYLKNKEVCIDSPINKHIEEYFGAVGRLIIPLFLGKEKEVLSKLSALYMDHSDMQQVFKIYFKEFMDTLLYYIDNLHPQKVIISGSITKSKRFMENISSYSNIEIRNSKNVEGIKYYE